MSAYLIIPLLLTAITQSSAVGINARFPQDGSSSNGQPCGLLAEAQAQSLQPFKPSAVLDCLQSVPLARRENILQVQGLKTWLEFQSTLAYLKDPPPGFLYPGVDMMAALDDVEDKLNGDFWDNEYDFQLDLYKIVSSAYDGHLNYFPDITQVFAFGRRVVLVPVSQDGTSLPDIYTSDDIDALADGGDVSPVTEINGQDVESFLNDIATMSGGSQDPDANYNSLFPNIPLIASQTTTSLGFFSQSILYQGDTTNITFANGSTMTDKAYAETLQDLSGIENGRDFFQKFCTGGQQVSAPEGSAVPTPTASLPSLPTTYVPFTPLPSGSSDPRFSNAYPRPLTVARDLTVAGYLPDGEDYAVLSVPSFFPVALPSQLRRAIIEWQNVVRETIATAKSRGRKKLVLDLRGNGGGVVFLAYDLFKQLFPDLTPYGATNFRASNIFNDMGKVLSEINADVTTENVTNDDIEQGFSTIFNYDQQVDEDNKDFSSWADFYGPEEHHGGEFTSLVRYNLSNYYQTTPVQVTGYLNNTQSYQAPFAAEDIIILQDGQCASTCAVFAEFMKTQAGVKQIVVGGRKQDGPMQGVGGVKGANVFTFGLLGLLVQAAYSNAGQTSEGSAYWRNTYGQDIVAGLQAYARAAYSPSSGERLARVNVRNNIREDDDSVTPLQFVYEAADCRFFYTNDMYRNQSMVWSYAYDAMNDDSKCVRDSTGAASSLSGASGDDLQDDIDEQPPSSARNLFGADRDTVFPSSISGRVEASSPTSAPQSGNTSGGSNPSPSETDTPPNAASGTLTFGGGTVLIWILGIAAGFVLL